MGDLARIAVLLTLVLCTNVALAEGPLSSQLPKKANLAKLIGDRSGSAVIKDAVLLGKVTAKTKVMKNGGLELVKKKVYDRVHHPETGKIHKLKDPWTVDYRWELGPRLRIVTGMVERTMPRSIEASLGGFPFFEKYEKYLRWDEWRIGADKKSTVLAFKRSLEGKLESSETHDYDHDDVPVQIIELALAAAALHGVKTFEIDVMLPDGSTHGLDVTASTSKDLAAVNDQYPFPKSIKRGLALDRPATVYELRLSSPVKRLFFPHRFYVAYSNSSRDFLGFWGGKPDPIEYRYAFNAALGP